jgi:hydrogenase nickel incorporation protein HypA/HybF
VHELSVSEAVLDTVLRHAGGRRVTRVDLKVGALRQVVPESLEFYFGIVTRDTLCEGALLAQELEPARVRCPDCGAERELDLPLFLCEVCGSGCEVVAGDELMVESIELEEEPACTGAR